MTEEGKIQKVIVDYLKIQGWLVFRMNAGKTKINVTMNQKGTPDLLAISPTGGPLWIEVKTPAGIVNEAQEAMHLELRHRYHKVAIVRSVEDVEKAIA